MKSTLWMSAMALAVALPAMAQAPTPGNMPVQRELIYCADLMTHDEREAYRTSMQAAATPKVQDALRAEHQLRMQERTRTSGRADACEAPLHRRAGQDNPGGAVK